MVRRGGRAAAPVTARNNSSTSSSNGSNQNGSRWSRSRPASANSNEIGSAKGTKSIDSLRSSPNGSSSSSSPPAGKKNQERGGKGARSSSHWRARGSGSGRNNTSAAAGDSKFSITIEDFPALPGARGGTSHQMTPGKGQRRDKEGSGRHGSASSNTELTHADDSGVSSSSRGHTPIQDTVAPITANAPGSVVKTNVVEKKKSTVPSIENQKKKANTSERPPRNVPKSLRPIIQASFGSASPKKKSINAANTASTAPSFMKLSKLGQKIPERRGGTRINNQSPPSICPPSPSEDSGKENDEKPDRDPKIRNALVAEISRENEEPRQASVVEVRVEQKTEVPRNVFFLPSYLPTSQENVPRTDVPQICLGPDGVMSNIPSTMLTDQFGMAALLPILEIVKTKNNRVDPSEEGMRKKLLDESIEMISIGSDLNELGVPIKTGENTTVWQSFAGPFGSVPLAPTCMGLSNNQVPSVYYTARTLQSTFDMAQNIPEKFGVHELFYIFYNMPKELWQLNAARELQYRGWRFNIKERLWVHKKLGEPDEFGISVQASQNPFTQPGINQEDVMIGIFEIYDAEKARITSREMCLRRSDFEVPAWEQRTPDSYQKMVATVFPKEVLWGPRDDRNKMSAIPGMAGLVSASSALAGRSRGNKLANLVIPKQQPPSRRLLSFADSPDLTPSFDSPFGNLTGPATSEDLYRQQMYSVILQKMQMQQQAQFQQQRPATQNSLSSSSSSSAYFQP